MLKLADNLRVRLLGKLCQFIFGCPSFLDGLAQFPRNGLFKRLDSFRRYVIQAVESRLHQRAF